MPKVRDHPRVCGAHESRSDASTTERGSPPRMRGAHAGMKADATLDGITPAYAGRTKRATRKDGMLRDHPRVCGAHL